MRIGEAASCLGVAVPTLRRWHRDGRLCPKVRTPGGHRRYDAGDVARLAGTQPAERSRLKTIAYARVSSHDQKADLTRQAERLRQHCLSAGHANIEVIQDLGSGLNDNKRGLRRLLRLICHGQVDRLVVTPRTGFCGSAPTLCFRSAACSASRSWFSMTIRAGRSNISSRPTSSS